MQDEIWKCNVCGLIHLVLVEHCDCGACAFVKLYIEE
jgi:hypothetical protein